MTDNNKNNAHLFQRSECETSLLYLKYIADEKCRKAPILGAAVFANGTIFNTYLNTGCRQASQDVINEANKCLELQKKNKSTMGFGS